MAIMQSVPAVARPEPILQYIRSTWKTLTRSNRDLPRAAADPKVKAKGPLPVYVQDNVNREAITAELREQLSAAAFHSVSIVPLPKHPSHIREQGLLYLPYPYVVPGGRFNEMYGWDSYFIQLGLLRDGEIELAKDMAGNLLYEVREYGQVLNANRTYYLTRSQPPFLSEMVLGVYRRTKDRAWLANALPTLQAYYQFWVREPHLTASTGLSRYYDLGEGPAPEVLAAEPTYYEKARDYLRSHTIHDYDAGQYYDRAKNRLKPLFYQGDRSMRESGFDPSNRFGPFNVDIIHYNPVCLNSLLYLMEVQLAEISDILGHAEDAQAWRARATDRAAKVNRYMWDEKDGLYYDFNFATEHMRRYPFLTTFYPLWTGIATPEQAARVVENLSKFEKPGGLQTSTLDSGDQWDAPFGWAPLQWIAVEGLRRYGYKKDADRISLAFLSLVQQEYSKFGNIDEKYDVVHRASKVNGEIRYGYNTNEPGFGWTNAVYEVLYDQLDSAGREKLHSAE
jgi:alpha,alpha-trehalase